MGDPRILTKHDLQLCFINITSNLCAQGSITERRIAECHLNEIRQHIAALEERQQKALVDLEMAESVYDSRIYDVPAAIRRAIAILRGEA